MAVIYIHWSANSSVTPSSGVSHRWLIYPTIIRSLIFLSTPGLTEVNKWNWRVGGVSGCYLSLCDCWL